MKEKRSSKMLLKVLGVIGILFLILIVAMGGVVIWAFNYHKKLKAIPVKNVDLAKVKDGSYEAKWDAGWWSVPVKVTVANHKITEAKVVKTGANPAIEKENELLARIVKKQSLDVDAIAGSSITTKAVLKSAEEALEKGLI